MADISRKKNLDDNSEWYSIDSRSPVSIFTDLFDAKQSLIFLVVLFGFFVYLPILSLIAFSFNEGGLSFPITEISLTWYEEMLSDDKILSSIQNSLKLALVTMIISTAMATATVLAFRYKLDNKIRIAVLILLTLGIIVPSITYSMGATLVINDIFGFRRSLWSALPVHVVWSLPFCVIFLIVGFPPHLAKNEEAARMMGASRWTVFRRIVLPQVAPAVLGVMVFAFTLSYNESTRSILLLGRDVTMPAQIYAIASSAAPTPELFALGSVTTVVSATLLSIAGYLVLRNNSALDG